MILGFKQYRDAAKTQPTHFKEKILSGEKKHTIRLDPHNRWKAGNSIQFAYGVRTPQYECFKTGVCRSIQGIFICWGLSNDGTIYPTVHVADINGEERLSLHADAVEVLAKNDGFDCIEDFLMWFSPDGNPYYGKLIHWTDLIY